jgi:ribosomal 50S subunit-recycling heat shock protein
MARRAATGGGPGRGGAPRDEADASRRDPPERGLRLDVLLFELRLFKSRSQAREAIQHGRALLNGERAKPSHEARAGDRVTLVHGPGEEEPRRSRVLEVLALPRASLSRQGARALVREIPGE